MLKDCAPHNTLHLPTCTQQMRLNDASCMHRRPINHTRIHSKQATRCQATKNTIDAPPQYTEGTEARPRWAGGGLLSDLANLAITTPPVYALLTRAAKFVLKRGAQKQGIDWDGTVQRLQTQPQVCGTINTWWHNHHHTYTTRAPQIMQHFAALENPSITYPDYYQRPFHAYPMGNLEWLAAYEAEPATLSVAMRAWRDPTITPTEAHTKLRNRIAHLLQVGCW